MSAACCRLVGVSWANFDQDRWTTDEIALKTKLDEAGANYVSYDANSSAAKQFTDIAKALPKNRSVSMRVLRQGRASFITFKLAE